MLQNNQIKIPDHLRNFSNTFSFSMDNIKQSLILNVNLKNHCQEKNLTLWYPLRQLEIFWGL